MRKKLILKVLFVFLVFFAMFLTGCEETTINELKSEHGIIVEGGSFDEGSKLISQEIDIESEQGRNLLKTLENKEYNNDGLIYIFDIYVMNNNVKVQPNGKVKVTIPIPNQSFEEYIVFHIKDSGEVKELTPSHSGNNLIIEVDSFSYFVIVEKEQTHTHRYSSVVTEPTCTEQGFTTYTCNCGDKYLGDYTDALGHQFDEGNVIVEPSHFEEGIRLYICLRCQATKEESIEKLSDHEFTEWYPCDQDETKHERLCKCGEKETGNCEFDDGKVTKEPSHFEEGIKTYTCAECGRTKEESIEKLSDHEFTEWYPCDQDETKHECLCKCGERETGNCVFDEGKVTKEPSHLEEGIKTYTCTECGRTKEEKIAKNDEHAFGNWTVDQTTEDKHYRECACGEKETGTCSFDEGKVTKEPSHLEEGIKTYTCTECGRTKEEKIEKTKEHSFGKWIIDQTTEDKHYRECACGEKEIGNCAFDEGKVTKEPSHIEEGIKTYTCTECGRTKEDKIEKTKEHSFGNWTVDQTTEDKHYRECACGEKETGTCSFDEGKVTKEPSHLEEGIKTYTCTECGRTKEEKIEKTKEHSFGNWTVDQTTEDKHYRECACGEKETGTCSFDEGTTDKDAGLITYTCTICGREKEEKVNESIEGIIIVISDGVATFEGKETVSVDNNVFGEGANVYIAQLNDVLNVSLIDQEGRTLKYWVSGTGTIIPDEDFSMLVLRSGYYYPIFEDSDVNDFTNRQKVFEGNCEEGIVYMSTNAKGDVKYEVEYLFGGMHDFYELKQYDETNHKQICSICGEIRYEKHTEYESEIVKEAGHVEEGQIKYECFCGHEWYESIPVTEEHTIDYDDWHIVEESKNGKYGKYKVYCKYCDYSEEYWYLGDQDFIGFVDNKMINYQYTYGGKVCHNEYYYAYKNAEGQKIYIWAFQYENEYSSNSDYNDTYIFMYIDDEDSTTLEPIYLSKSKGDKRSEYLWAIYGYAYDVNDWIKTLDSPDYNIGCGDGMLLSNSMSARSSVFESYHDYWAEIYNNLRIPTTKEYNDLTNTPWELDYEGKSFQGGYYDENGEYVTTGGRDTISYVKDKGTSYKKYIHVDKETGITYGYEDYGTYFRTIFFMRECKEIVSPEEYEKLDDAGKSVVYSYGDIEKDIKSLCSKRNAFNNFTLEVPETINAFRLLFSDPLQNVTISGANVNVYYNSAYVYNSGSPITLEWEEVEGVAFDYYEIWDFELQAWVKLSDSPTYVFNTLENPRRNASYIRVVSHEVDKPVVPGEKYRVSVENGYFEINDIKYNEPTSVEAGTSIYAIANEIVGKTFDHWVDNNGNEYYSSEIEVTSDLILTPVYEDTNYQMYVTGWEYESYIKINDGEFAYMDEMEGKLGESVELTTTPLPEGENNVFIGWFFETVINGSWEYILVSDKQTFTYVIEGDISGGLYAVWTTGENPFTKSYVDIRATNGFVMYAGGEVADSFDNAYSVISLSIMGRVNIYDDPTDDTVYTLWDIAFRYELEGEIMHNTAESYQDEYDFYPANFWIDDPKNSYPDGVINVTGIIQSDTNFE